MRRLWFRSSGNLALALSFVFMAPVIVHAQGGASILGTVKDPTGAVVVGVEIEMLNEETGLQRRTSTNEVGYYQVDFLPIGVYSVTAQSSGFRTWQTTAVTLETGQKARVDIELEVGQVAETVTVEGAVTLVESEHSTMGEVITGSQIVDLPLNNRQFMGLVTLGPGTAPAPTDFRSRESGGRGVVVPSAAGGRPEDNNYKLDGIDNREIGRANFAISPSIDSIAEFKVTMGIPSAEHGRVASAVIEVTTKSGTNELHGSLFEFLRNDTLDARNFFAREASPLKRNQFGGSIGGPILKDKHLFFVAYEQFTERISGSPVVGLVPTADMQRGIFPGAITDPLSNNDPFLNNTIPADRIDPISTNILPFFATPNSPDPRRNFNFTRDSTKEDKDLLTVRTDHYLGERDHLYGRYVLDDEGTIQAPTLPTGTGGILSGVRAQGVAVHETHTFGPTMVNQASFGWTRFDLTQHGPFAFQRDVAGELGIELVGLGDDPLGWAFPSVRITGFRAPSGTIPRPRKTDIFQLKDTLLITRGRHAFRTGVDFRDFTSDNFSPGQLNGSFSFRGSFTGNSFADFLLGWPLSAARNIDPAEQNASMRYFAWFLADDWKVNDRLTLNLGIRYEVESPLSESRGEIARFDLQTGQVMFPEATRSRVEPFYQEVLPDVPVGFFPEDRLYNRDSDNIAPRFGFAYRPFADNTTVVRGGFGIFYSAPQMTTLLASVSAPPWSKRPAQNSDSSFPEVRWNPPGGLEQAIRGPFTCFCMVTPELPYAYVEQWGLTLQRALGSTAMVEVGYVGSHSVHLFSFMQRNLAEPGPGSPVARSPYPQWSRIQSSETGFHANYNALTVKAEKRAGHGLSFLAAYTYGKAIDQASTWNQVSISRPDNRRDLETGLADFDVRHRMSLSYSYELPFGAGRKFLSGAGGAAARLVEGWGVRGITTFSSGSPRTLIVSRGIINSGAGVNPHPFRISDGNLPASQRSIDRWFDTAAFPLPARFTLGNSGRNIIIGPGLNNFDISVFKKHAHQRVAAHRISGGVLQRVQPPELRTAGKKRVELEDVWSDQQR